MIGNVDWFILMLCNFKILKFMDGGLNIVVFYDFDFFGIVNVGYVVLVCDIGQEKVGERVYLGVEFNSSEL